MARGAACPITARDGGLRERAGADRRDPGELVHGVSRRRWVRLVTEAEYDAVAWIGGLLVASRAEGAMADAYLTRFALWYGPAQFA